MARDGKHAYLMGASEALLFVSDEPVSTAKLAQMLSADLSEVEEALALLAAEYADDNRGMQLREVAGGWRFYTHPAYHDLIENFVISWDTHRMSQAALEALAIIAYHQPVTRAAVNAIRGVNSESVISSLIEKGLVREVGKEKPGGAIFYGTTRSFLERFGLKSVNDLPPLEDFAPDDESREYIRERLSGAGKTDMQLEFVEPEADASGGGAFAQVEEVDTGDDVRVDDAAGVAEVISVSMTEKVDDFLDAEIQDIDGLLDEYYKGDEPEEEPAEELEDEVEEDEDIEEEADDDIFDEVEEEESDEAYSYFDDDEDDDDDSDEEADEDDDPDDEIELYE